MTFETLLFGVMLLVVLLYVANVVRFSFDGAFHRNLTKEEADTLKEETQAKAKAEAAATGRQDRKTLVRIDVAHAKLLVASNLADRLYRFNDEAFVDRNGLVELQRILKERAALAQVEARRMNRIKI